jgi:hypothetical protein
MGASLQRFLDLGKHGKVNTSKSVKFSRTQQKVRLFYFYCEITCFTLNYVLYSLYSRKRVAGREGVK